MTDVWPGLSTSIERLTVYYRAPEETLNAPRVRLGVERLLQTIDLQPHDLPPDVVLIVRQFRCTTPLVLPAASITVQQRSWAESMRRQMSVLYRTAARPAQGVPSAEATSVLFADTGEMLICLTRDLVAGRAWQQWYWRQLLRNSPLTPGLALATIWSTHAMYVPMALGRMGAAEASRVVALLSTAEVSAVVRALHSAFTLPAAILEVTIPSPERPSQSAATSSEQSSSRRVPIIQLALPDRSSAPPWQRWLPASLTRELTPRTHYLLGLCVALYQAPAFARGIAFARQSAAWFQDAISEISPSLAASLQASETGTSCQIASPFSIADQKVAQAATLSQADAAPAEIVSPSDSYEAPVQTARTNYQEQKRESLREMEFGAEQLFPAEGHLTQLGGILYLTHLLRWLELADCDEREEAITSFVGGWGIIAALALALLGRDSHSCLDDPIWHILAGLDRRETSTPIGAALPFQAAFRLPAHWLRRADNTQRRWNAATDGTRLLLFDEADGYLVADVPLLNRSLSGSMQAEIEAYRLQGIAATWSGSVYHLDEKQAVPLRDEAEEIYTFSLDAGIPSLLGDHMLWWIERVLGFVSYLLARALGLADMNTLAETLLYKRGQLVASRTHVDLYMHLDQVSVAVRRSGLDSDPGWMPDLGRIVLFHFG